MTARAQNGIGESGTERKGPKLWHQLLFVVVASLVVLTLLEGALQVHYRIKHGRWLSQAPTVFRIHFTQPVADAREYSLRPGYKDDLHEINQDGFRGKLVPHDTDRPTIVVLGDSVPFGLFVHDTETYPYYLQSLLEEAGAMCEVINAGVPSYTLRQSFERYEIDVLSRYSPDLVIVQAANDVSLQARYGRRWSPELTWAEERFARRWRSTSYNLALPYYVSVIAQRLDTSKGTRYQDYPAQAMISFLDGYLGDRLEQFEEQSIPVILLPINPFHYQLRNKERNAALRARKSPGVIPFFEVAGKALEAYNELLIRSAAQWDHVYFLDMRRIMDDMDRERLFIDDIHHSAEGNRVVAEQLCTLILEQKLIPVSER